MNIIFFVGNMIHAGEKPKHEIYMIDLMIFSHQCN